jgi:hypothetical protein
MPKSVRTGLSLLAAAALVILALTILIAYRQPSVPPERPEVEAVGKTREVHESTAPVLPEALGAIPDESEPPAAEMQTPEKRARVTRDERREGAREHLLSDNLRTKRRAVSILGRLGTDDDIRTIAELLSHEQDQRTRVMMIRALRRRETPESIRALRDCLSSDNERVQIAAVRSLSRMKSPEASAYLQDALENGEISNISQSRLVQRVIPGAPGATPDSANEQPQE